MAIPRRPWAEAAFVLILPPLLFFAYRTSPINQAGTIDPWVYMGYIHNFRDLIDRAGLTYYAVRFGLILPGIVLTRLLGAEPGYFATVYAFYLVAGVPLYLALRKHLGVAAACAGYLTFLSSVWVARTILWQYVDSAVLAYLMGATALILLDPARRRPAYVLVGVLWGLALHSNAVVLGFVALASIPYAVMNAENLRSRLVPDLLCAAAGVAAVTLAGVVFYGWTVGEWNIFQPTLRMIAWKVDHPGAPGSSGSGQWLRVPWLLYPAFVLGAAGALWLRRGARRPALVAAALYAAGCCIVLLLGNPYRVGWATYYYFSMLAAPVMLLACMLPGVIMTLGQLLVWQRALVAVSIAAVPLTGPALAAVARAGDPVSFLVALGVVLTLVWLSPRGRWISIVACVLVAVLSHLQFIVAFGGSPPSHPGFHAVFGSPASAAMDTYRLAPRLIAAMPKHAADGMPLRFWLARDPGPQGVLGDLQSTYLWAHSRLQGPDDRRGAPEIGDHERALLSGSESFHLAVLAMSHAELAAARAALERERVRFSSVFERTLCGRERCVLVELLAIRPSAGYWLSGGPDVSGRPVLAADASALGEMLERNLYGRFGKARAVALEDDRLVFRPTSATDHLATPLLSLRRGDVDGPIGVRVTLRMPDRAAGRCRLVLQSQAYRPLATALCPGESAEGIGAGVFEFTLPADVTAIRAVLSSADGRRADLPATMRIELLAALTPSGLSSTMGRP